MTTPDDLRPDLREACQDELRHDPHTVIPADVERVVQRLAGAGTKQ
jgi:hypothetical protein